MNDIDRAEAGLRHSMAVVDLLALPFWAALAALVLGTTHAWIGALDVVVRAVALWIGGPV